MNSTLECASFLFMGTMIIDFALRGHVVELRQPLHITKVQPQLRIPIIHGIEAEHQTAPLGKRSAYIGALVLRLRALELKGLPKMTCLTE